MNADLLPSTLDNTFIYEIMYRTLFGDVLPNLVDGTPKDETLVGEAENDLIRGDIGDDIVAGGLGDDILYGEEGADVLRGDLNSRSPQGKTGGDDILYGGLGDDRLGGKGGNDQLFGDEGDDKLWGDDGDDLLYGGLGDDRLVGDDFSGGAGSDVFVLAVGEGTDTIVDFEIGTDFIGLAGGLEFGQVSLTQDNGDTLIGFEDETLAILKGVTASLTSSDFVSVVL
jgi:glycerophosphoryl diester phosphodiesterase